MTAIEPLAEDWGQLLGRPTAVKNMGRLSAVHAGKAVMITGAGGSIGSALALQIARSGPRVLVLVDTCEQSLYRINGSINRSSGHMPIIVTVGDAGNRDLLDDIFWRYRPDIIYHAAAHKHGPLMEANPFAAIGNNALGTYCLTRAAMEHHIGKVVMISTDKAANPISIMGASKRIAEMALQTGSSPGTQMASIRLGNVLGSQGSVVPLFLEQIYEGGPVTVTHSDVERFFLTMEEAVSLVFEAAACAPGSRILVPEMRQQVKIIALAKYLIQRHSAVSAGEIPIVLTGLRPGDKMQEKFIASDEQLAESVSERLHCLQSTWPAEEMFASAMAELESTTRARDLDAMLHVVRGLVPQYEPGVLLAGLAAVPLVDAHE